MATSQRRNSAFSRPSPWRVMRPVTSAWALMVFQFWNCGGDVDIDDLFDEGGLIDRREQSAALEVVGDDLGDADADLAVRRRSRRRNSESRSAAARSCRRVRLQSLLRLGLPASDGSSQPAAAPSAADQDVAAVQRQRSDDRSTLSGMLLAHFKIIDSSNICLSDQKSMSMYFHSSIGLVWQHVYGWHCDDRANGAHPRRAWIARRASGRRPPAVAASVPIRLEPDPTVTRVPRDVRSTRLGISTALASRARHRVKFGLRQCRRGLPCVVPSAALEFSVVAGRRPAGSDRACRAAPRSWSDRRRVPASASAAAAARPWLPASAPASWLFRFQGLRDRIDLGRIRLLLDRLRLVLGLVLGDRLRRIGLFLDRLFHRLRRRLAAPCRSRLASFR